MDLSGQIQSSNEQLITKTVFVTNTAARLQVLQPNRNVTNGSTRERTGSIRSLVEPFSSTVHEDVVATWSVRLQQMFCCCAHPLRLFGPSSR